MSPPVEFAGPAFDMTSQDAPAPNPADTPTSAPSPAAVSSDSLPRLLARPISDRLREYKYWCAQAVVFGLPVLALQAWGPSLGGRESGRWVGGLQALLSGWVLYVAAAGMLFEGLLLLRRRRPMADLIVAAVAIGLYCYSAVALGRSLFTTRTGRPLFHAVVILLAGWCGLRWAYLARRLAPPRSGSQDKARG